MAHRGLLACVSSVAILGSCYFLTKHFKPNRISHSGALTSIVATSTVLSFSFVYLLRYFARFMPPRFVFDVFFLIFLFILFFCRFLVSSFNFFFDKRSLEEINKETSEKAINKIILKYGDDHPEIFRVCNID